MPEKYTYLFEGAERELNSHQGWDPGAYSLFCEMAKSGVDYTLYSTTTRLLVDLNRSLFKRSLFSEFSIVLPQCEKATLIKQNYTPFRQQFSTNISRLLYSHKFVMHVSVHSFTPVLNQKVRNADIGILFDPGFGIEKILARKWRSLIKAEMPKLNVRFNYPYRGKPGGHVFDLRKQFGAHCYAGIELEMNQKYAFDPCFHQVMREIFSRFVTEMVL